MGSTTNTCLILLICVGVSYSFKHRCSRLTFFDQDTKQCRDCSLCAPGTFMKSRCRGTQDTVCKDCRRGYYSTTYTRFPGRCRQCSACGDRPVVKKCTKTADTVCGDCPLGTYRDYLTSRCVQCSYCFPEYSDSIPIEPTCEKPQIPASHRCIQIAWVPYEPPLLISQTDKDGNEYFVSSKKIEKDDDQKEYEISPDAVYQNDATFSEYPEGQEYVYESPQEIGLGSSKKQNNDDDELEIEVKVEEFPKLSYLASQGESTSQEEDKSLPNQDELKDKSIAGPTESNTRFLVVCGVVVAVCLVLIASVAVICHCYKHPKKVARTVHQPLVRTDKVENYYAQLKNENFV